MKYSSAYLLQVAQNAKTTPPIPPQSPNEALMAVLDAGFALKRHPSCRGALVVDGNGVAQPWPELPTQMERFLELNFLGCAGKRPKSPNAGVRMSRLIKS